MTWCILVVKKEQKERKKESTRQTKSKKRDGIKEIKKKGEQGSKERGDGLFGMCIS